jgi:hypothetical protein
MGESHDLSGGETGTDEECRYPGRIEEHHHKTLAYLPTDIALALSDSPGLVAEAIAAFYEREPQTLRVRLLPLPPSLQLT